MNAADTAMAALDGLRPRLAEAVPMEKRKGLGQCFTGMATARLLAALSLRQSHKVALDPMAGHGDLLEACAERAARLRSALRMYAVEIDPYAARLGEERMDACRRVYPTSRTVYRTADAFAPSTWASFREAVPADLTITNPPYVRYQTLSRRTAHATPSPMDAEATRKELGKVADVWAEPTEAPIFRELISAYSGLADLSVPSWLLCGLLTKPGGTLALVVPQTWLNRDYAKLIRYFFLRCFEPLAVVQESGRRMFQDVLVPVSLVVGRRLSPDQVVIPLAQRLRTSSVTAFAELGDRAATDESHVAGAFPADDPEAEFAQWLFGRTPRPRAGVRATRISLQSQFSEVFSACSRCEWWRELEGVAGATASVSLAHRAQLPPAIAAHIPRSLAKTQPLEETPIQVGQGLRTGCNGFFYVDEVSVAAQNGAACVRTSTLLGNQTIQVPRPVLRPVLRRQSEIEGPRIQPRLLSGRVIVLAGWYLPDELNNLPVQSEFGIASTAEIAVLSPELAAYVRQAAKTVVGKGSLAKTIPELSAVKTNGMLYSRHKAGSRQAAASNARKWYMLPPLARRHCPDLLIPRIVHDRPRPVLNSREPVIVDANFSALWTEDRNWHPHAVFALFSSTWVQLCLEALASPMGGGALKVEATHIRRIPLPCLNADALTALRLAGASLEHALSNGAGDGAFREVDRLVFSCLSGKTLQYKEARCLTMQVRRVVCHLRAKRQRNGRKVRAT